MTSALSTWWIFAPSNPTEEPAGEGLQIAGHAVPSFDSQRESRTATPLAGIAQDVLLARLRSENDGVARGALETIYLALFERLWRFAYLTVRERDVAEEVTQDVFFTLWQRRATIDIQGDIAVYLHGAVRHQAAKHIRHGRVVARYAETAEHAAVILPVARLADPEETLSAAEIERSFETALALIPERARQALMLRWRDGWTYEEVGAVLGISKVAARALVMRYQRRLAPFLEQLRQELHG